MKRTTALILCLLATPAIAETHDLGETVAGHPGVTYADLLKQGLPLISVNAKPKPCSGASSGAVFLRLTPSCSVPTC